MSQTDAGALARFYEEDHHRLDEWLEKFHVLRESDPAQAKQTLAAFRSGLEQHMAWEEAILFSEYDARVRPAEDGLTEALLSEHAEILNLLDRIEEKLAAAGADTSAEETRLRQALKSHNETEEQRLYGQLDRTLTNADRAEIFARMKEAGWDEGAWEHGGKPTDGR